MPDDDDFMRKVLATARNMTAADRAEIDRKAKVRAEKMTAEIAVIAERLLGVRPEHSDGIYTQHPVMAGVLRQALREAYEAGMETIGKTLIEAFSTRGLGTGRP